MDGDKGYDEKAAAFVSTPNQFFDDKAVRTQWRLARSSRKNSATEVAPGRLSLAGEC